MHSIKIHINNFKKLVFSFKNWPLVILVARIWNIGIIFISLLSTHYLNYFYNRKLE